MSIRAHLFGASFVFVSAAIAVACSSSPDADVAASSATTQALTDELSAYANDCDARMGGAAATVPAFDCNAQGIDLPVTLNGAQYRQGIDTQCDRPDMFGGQCRLYQKLVPIASTSTATTIAICRRFFPPASATSGFDEIDVIQHNKTTGDTCFYTSTMVLPDGSIRPPGSIPSKAPAPSQGVGTTGAFPFWQTPSTLASAGADSKCVSCHDNGAFIRSPFVKQVSSKLSSKFVADLGFGNNAYNLTQPYNIVGSVFASAGWKAVSISLANGDTTCTSCHRMGANTFGSGSTAEVLGPASVGCYGNQAANCAAYNEPDDFISNEQNPNFPHWMVPGHTTFNPTFLNVAHELKACALAWRTANQTSPPGPLPASCVAEPLTDYCENDNQCYGRLPRICHTCSDGSTACAHHACINHQCGIGYCP